MKTQINQTKKTKLSPQSPQWSRHSVARVRRRGDRPPSTLHEGVVCCLFGMENMVRQGILSLLAMKNEMEVAT